jgi:sirohydrochlorin cobaltochelatase
LPVSHDDFTDAGLVLLGHGSTKNADSAEPVFQHAAELRQRRIFASVHEAFWKQEPRVQTVLSTVSAPRIFIVPLFISEGYFSTQVIPQALGFSGAGARLKTPVAELFYCQPIGTHDSMTNVLLTRARDIVEKFPFPHRPKPGEVTLIIAGHGTEQNENSRKAIEHQVKLIRDRAEYAAVHAVFLEEEPRIGQSYQLAQTRYMVVVPFFISDGMHTQEDIPVLLGEARPVIARRLAAGQPVWRNPAEHQGKLVWYTPAAGTAPEVADVIIDRVRQAAQ